MIKEKNEYQPNDYDENVLQMYLEIDESSCLHDFFKYEFRKLIFIVHEKVAYCIFLTFKIQYLWKPYYEEIRFFKKNLS